MRSTTLDTTSVPGQKLGIPVSLQTEHQELHTTLAAYTKLPGQTGVVAKEVAEILHPHFIKEELYALPPLGLLSALAGGETISDKKEAIALSEKLKTDLPEMLAEHKQIVIALDRLGQVAKGEQHPDVMEFAEKLKLHAKTEEEVLYPAAILVGEYLKLKS